MKHTLFFILFLFLFVGCKSKKDLNSSIIHSPKKELSAKEMQTWYQKDIVLDGIPGISLDKWYASNKKKPQRKNIIVAVIDTQIDLHHEDLQGQFWTNSKEIPNNGIDDDKNGYIDDINGWNFKGTKNGGYLVWGNYDYTRIVREWEPVFKDKTEPQIDSKDLHKYKEYNRALTKLEGENKYYKNWLKSLDHSVAIYPLVKDTLKYFFPKEDYTYNQLDSLYKKNKINDKRYKQRRDDNDKDLGALISYMMVNLEVDQKTLKDVVDQQSYLDSVVNKNINKNFNDRLLIGDNPNILEKGYGNNILNNKAEYQSIQDHSTKVTGVIAANRENNIGIKGIGQNVKIMPLSVIPVGDEQDKDVAMAIYYAVDNGAKIINMSFGKEFSLHKEWVEEAFKYAEEHNVLLVHCAGNDGFDIDKNPFYPNDSDFENYKEKNSNFLNIGSTTHRLDSTFVSDFSNHGKHNVDIFAPGDEIYSTTTENSHYKFDSGTSFAGPMVSGTAALIWLYYPSLTAAQVKQIILASGSSYNLEVIVPGTKDKKVPFSELSKSGKVLNVYNAMQLAEKVSKEKK
ncbi:S8 family serine peptidase [Flavobacterium sp. LC2016-12]|uniref:S8 family serine peptidase n=1 Tax=Flavobacterium sp. LC2016-12 TaxID=2783794 RepID=UPI00188B45FF|nr:S8 family serine peptidase [Flavobacterium sp. LC2016-12]MBF4466841.1 S8 family serine peptidase [Flavobacterium sp. LC2016-12]